MRKCQFICTADLRKVLCCGYKIKVGVTDIETIGIDTPEDLERAKTFAASIGFAWND